MSRLRLTRRQSVNGRSRLAELHCKVDGFENPAADAALGRELCAMTIDDDRPNSTQ
jgi:hypothetical protein